MKILFLKIYGINVKVSSNSGYAFENLEKDFTLFLNTKEDFCLSGGMTINVLKEAY